MCLHGVDRDITVTWYYKTTTVRNSMPLFTKSYYVKAHHYHTAEHSLRLPHVLSQLNHTATPRLTLAAGHSVSNRWSSLCKQRA